jgi:hypothetical protein
VGGVACLQHPQKVEISEKAKSRNAYFFEKKIYISCVLEGALLNQAAMWGYHLLLQQRGHYKTT